MNVQRPLHALTADQQRLIETIASAEHTRLLVIGPPGTGKTYAVSVAVSELLAHVREARVLILAPAALCAAHVAMLADRLQDAAPVVRVTGGSDLSIQEQAGDGGWQPGVYVISIDLAKREDFAASLTGSAWDLVVVDEAHGVTKTRADLVVRLAADERVRSLVLLSVLPLKDKRLINCLSVVRWTRTNTRPSSRVQTVISYERAAAEQELYFRLMDFLDTHANNLVVRDVIERAWRSSIIALEQVILRARSTLQVSDRGPHRLERWPLTDPLVLSEQTMPEQLADAPTAWLDTAAAAAGMDGLLRHISALGIDSKLEAMLTAIDHRRVVGAYMPCVVTAMRESAAYIAQALESRQQASNLVDGQSLIAPGKEVGADGAVVVATDLGLKGLELSTDAMLNYDLPRSRLRIEQRWGRVDRVGREQLHNDACAPRRVCSRPHRGRASPSAWFHLPSA